MRRPVRTITRPPISSRRMRFGEPTSSRPSGVTVAALSPSPCSRIACAASWTTSLSVARRDCKREIETGELELEPGHLRREHAQRLLEQFLPGLVPFQHDDRFGVHGFGTSGGACRGRGAGDVRARADASATSTRAAIAITDEEKLERIESLVIPPAWKDVWISPQRGAKLQATGVDAAGRKQYLYHATFRAQQEQAKFDQLIRFAERLPDLRLAMAEHMDNEPLDRERVSAIATRLINRGWFRVGTERYAKESKTFGITTLRKGHVRVRGHRIAFDFRGKHKSLVRTTLVDEELADAIKELLALPRRRPPLPLRVG